MTLADMIITDEDALICDLAETYHIYDYRSLPVKLVATLSVGLREDSRIKLKISGQKRPINTILLAVIADRITRFFYSFSEDAKSKRHEPKSLLAFLLDEKPEAEVQSFNSAEDFERRRREIINGVVNDGN